MSPLHFRFPIACLLFACVLFTGCASNPDSSANADPWEPMNRKIYAFNDTADRYLVKPVAKGYRWVMPDFLENGVSNVFANLFEVTTVANDLLQFKFGQAASDTGRFLINTTVGLGGFFDVANKVGLEKHNEDFGQTLGYWGVKSGPYVVLPFLGSSTVRDGAMLVPETFTSPIGYVDHVPTRNSSYLLEKLDERVSLLDAEDLISGDPYTFIRNAYLQRREYLVKDGVVEDDFGDEEESWGDDAPWDE